MKTEHMLLIGAAVAVALYMYSQQQSAVQVESAPVSNVNGQTLYSPASPIANGGTANGVLSQLGAVFGSSGVLGDTNTLNQANSQNLYSGAGANPSLNIGNGAAATPYSNGPQTTYADAYSSSPPDPSYTANLMASDDPSTFLDEEDA